MIRRLFVTLVLVSLVLVPPGEASGTSPGQATVGGGAAAGADQPQSRSSAEGETSTGAAPGGDDSPGASSTVVGGYWSLVLGCSNTSFTVQAAHRPDLFSVSMAGGTVDRWVKLGYAEAQPGYWPRLNAYGTDPDAIWVMLCEHVGTVQSILEDTAQLYYFIRFAGFTAPVYFSGINGYDPPRDFGWPNVGSYKGAIATIATNAAARAFVNSRSGQAVFDGPAMDSVELLPSECLKGGLSPHPNKIGQAKLGAVLAPFPFGYPPGGGQ